jgi:hypothetical protein
MKEPIKELDIGDPFDHLAKQSFRNAARFGFPSQFINEAIAIVRSAFGQDWLHGMFEKSRKDMPVILQSKHPLVGCFTVAGENQIAEVMELAVYLKHLAKVKNLDYVITQMKEKFDSGLLQLAYAYRFLKLGATDLELEPASNKGRKGDIFCKLENLPCMVECYVPRSKNEDTSLELHHSVGTIFEALKAKNGIYRVTIKLKKSISAKDRKLIEGKIISMINNIQREEPAEEVNELAEIAIQNISKMEAETDFPTLPGLWTVYRGADWGVHECYVDRREIQNIRDGLDSHRRTGNRIFVWRTEAEKKHLSVEDRVVQLTKKISKKLHQAKHIDGSTKRVVVVSVAEGKHEDDDDLRICNELRERIVLGHSNVFMVILTSRVWMLQNRYKYVGACLFGKGLDYVPSEALFKKLNVFEQKHDILQDWG